MLLAMALAPLLARKGKRRRRYYNPNFVVHRVTVNMGLGALANEAVILSALTAFDQEYYAISADIWWSKRSGTAGEGPIYVGLASADMSTAEIIECLDASPVSKGDRVEIERSGRPVRWAGVFSSTAVDEILNDGKAIRTKLRFPTGNNSMNVWARNESGSTLTSGAVIEVHGKLYGRWT